MKFFVRWGFVVTSSIFVAGVALWLWTAITPGPSPHNVWGSIFFMGLLVVVCGLVALVNNVWPRLLGHAVWTGGVALALIALFLDGDGTWLRELGFLGLAVVGLSIGAVMQSRTREEEFSEKE